MAVRMRQCVGDLREKPDGLGNRELAGEITRRWYEQGQRRERRVSDQTGPNVPPGGDPPILD